MSWHHLKRALRHPWRTAREDQRGVIGLIGVIIYGAVISITGMTMVGSAVVSYNSSNKRIQSTQSFFNAESGAEDALMHINRDPTFGASNKTINLTFDSNNTNSTVVAPSSDPNCTGARTVTASGFYKTLVRKVQLTNCETTTSGGGSSSGFDFAAQADTGGIYLKNNARVTGGTYSNGSVFGESNNNLNGDVSIANTTARTQGASFEPTGSDFTFGNTAARTDAAQSFTAATAGGSNQILGLQLKVRKIGNPVNATVRLVADSGNQPGGQQFAQGTLFASSSSSTFEWEEVGFGTPATLTAGTKYWIVIDVPSTNGGNYWAWASENTLANQRGMHIGAWQNGFMVWTDGGTDLAFRTFNGSAPTYLKGVTVNGGTTTSANTIINSTINGAANFKSAENSTFNGTVNPGAADPAPKPLPISDAQLQAFRDEAATGGTINGNYNVTNNSTVSLGPKKINGDITLQNNSTLNLTGTIWVTGNVYFTNNSTVKLSSSFGPKSGVIYADGQVRISNNINVSGLNNNAIFLISYDASDNALTVENNANGIVFYAPRGRVWLKNNATGGAAAGNRLLLENNATLTYVSYLADVTFSAGGVTDRLTKGWREVVLN